MDRSSQRLHPFTIGVYSRNARELSLSGKYPCQKRSMIIIYVENGTIILRIEMFIAPLNKLSVFKKLTAPYLHCFY
jgi:hypothetical protein